MPLHKYISQMCLFEKVTLVQLVFTLFLPLFGIYGLKIQPAVRSLLSHQSAENLRGDIKESNNIGLPLRRLGFCRVRKNSTMMSQATNNM